VAAQVQEGLHLHQVEQATVLRKVAQAVLAVEVDLQEAVAVQVVPHLIQEILVQVDQVEQVEQVYIQVGQVDQVALQLTEEQEALAAVAEVT
jgi:hypothetical protein